MKFYRYRPEVSGDYGENTVYIGKRSDHPRVVTHLHYEFCYWPEDDMLACLFHFIGTERLKVALEGVSPPLTGIAFDQVEISGDNQEFRRVERKGRPDSALGKWYWFKITGKPGVDDFGLATTAKLVISERVVEVLKNFVVINPSRKITEYSMEIEDTVRN